MQKNIGAMEITFELLPQAVSQLFNKVENIERLLLEQRSEPLPEPDKWFDIVEFCNYHPDKPAVPTAYGWVHDKSVPYHKSGKKLRFLKSEIDVWLKEGRKKPLAEIDSEADTYIKCKSKLR
jgi:excisionase family DNA binding protein